MMRFDVLLTDLDNTLYDFAVAMELACQAVITRIGRGELNDLIHALIFSPHGVESYQALAEYLHIQGIEDELLLNSVWDEFERIKNQNIIPFPGVVAGLQQIHKAGVLIGAVTNATSYHAEERLNRIGVRTLIHKLISPNYIGKKKPDPEVYRLTAEMMSCPPHRICVLGDNLINDIAPAQNAGMFGIHARYGDRVPVEYTQSIIPDAIVDSFEDIIPILGVSYSFQ
jgi:putative hydrolase of the HAD superfamily